MAGEGVFGTLLGRLSEGMTTERDRQTRQRMAEESMARQDRRDADAMQTSALSRAVNAFRLGQMPKDVARAERDRTMATEKATRTRTQRDTMLKSAGVPDAQRAVLADDDTAFNYWYEHVQNKPAPKMTLRTDRSGKVTPVNTETGLDAQGKPVYERVPREPEPPDPMIAAERKNTIKAKMADKFIEAAGGDVQAAGKMLNASPADVGLVSQLGFTADDLKAAAQRYQLKQKFGVAMMTAPAGAAPNLNGPVPPPAP